MGVAGILDNASKINCKGTGLQVWLRIVVKMFLKKAAEKNPTLLSLYMYILTRKKRANYCTQRQQLISKTMGAYEKFLWIFIMGKFLSRNQDRSENILLVAEVARTSQQFLKNPVSASPQEGHVPAGAPSGLMNSFGSCIESKKSSEKYCKSL